MDTLFESERPDWTPPRSPEWRRMLEEFGASPEGLGLMVRLEEDIASGAKVFPPTPYRAFELTPYEDVKVVVLGQDPYHGDGQAHGLAFSVNPGVKVPPSLRNIWKELLFEGLVAGRTPSSGSLVGWASQGVLLMNAVLTVRAHEPASHKDWGWEKLTDEVIRRLNERKRPMVFMLWGKFAQAKRSLINAERHLVLEANHPSPLSATRGPIPFIGCGHFQKANDWLECHSFVPVDWSF